jgi:hypothetical protein
VARGTIFALYERQDSGKWWHTELHVAKARGVLPAITPVWSRSLHFPASFHGNVQGHIRYFIALLNEVGPRYLIASLAGEVLWKPSRRMSQAEPNGMQVG